MVINTIKLGIDNCYLLRDEGTILIDAGMPEKFEKFKKGLEKLSIQPGEIGLIVITHCHWDHIGCAARIKELTRAKLAVHHLEKDVMEEGKMLMPPGVTRWGKIFGAFLRKWSAETILEPAEVDVIIKNEDFPLNDFGIDGKIIYTPGHSSGSVSVLSRSGDAFVGDMAMNGLPLTLTPDLPIFAENITELIKSWRKLIDAGAEKIYPAHGKNFPVDIILSKF